MWVGRTWMILLRALVLESPEGKMALILPEPSPPLSSPDRVFCCINRQGRPQLTRMRMCECARPWHPTHFSGAPHVKKGRSAPAQCCDLAALLQYCRNMSA